ncbi:hydroxymethylglutaryl-CoA reductase [Burkholderia sp. MSMB1078WGS]|uniref:hydroxymethylglutaryl-CoA reductase n=1 Tax=Burkholderia sp. MSMB1078WGS TaxID=1637900 RepID=UPI0009EBEF81|nr:hydroxymethylglutaryl-CoA reductase [Burkholderia sp. MSMB1078WGS]
MKKNLAIERNDVPVTQSEVPFRRLRMPGKTLHTEEARQARLAVLQESSGYDLGPVAEIGFSAEAVCHNIEALIGSVEVPVGAAGPLLMAGQHARGTIYAPFATTEGALVASASRGAAAINLCGGVKVRVVSDQMMRVPVFEYSSVEEAVLVANWIESHFEAIQAQTAAVSKHAYLKQIQPSILGRYLHVAFIFKTGDAAGQNMTTSCTWTCCQWILNQLEREQGLLPVNWLIEGNVSSDKKVSFQSLIGGRGKRVIAECRLSEPVTKRILHVTPAQLCDAYQKLSLGAAAAGMVGVNINFANAVAAIFTATGQDIACSHESSLGLMNIHLCENGAAIQATAVLPSLIVGTVGGGTGLPKQRKFLELMGCTGDNSANRLAEIIAGYCLALDLSTLSAIASGEFVFAHNKYGRNHPDYSGRRENLNQVDSR